MKIFVKYRDYILPLGFVAIMFALWLIGGEMSLNDSFNGLVQNVNYNEKGIPTVTIKGIEYYLAGENWGHYQDKIETGDSMIKKKGELYIKLIKRNRIDTVKHQF